MHVRVTAYVVKVFSMAHSIFDVKEQVCEPLMYLVQETTRPSGGGFVERNPVYSTTMTVRRTPNPSKQETDEAAFISLNESFF